MPDLDRRALLRTLFGAATLSGGSLLLGTGLSGCAQSPARKPLLSAARDVDGRHSIRIFAFDHAEELRLPLPARAHELVAHPHRPEAICVARRPGLSLERFDLIEGTRLGRIEVPPTRRFYGHGAFSADGARFYTSENDFASGRGKIGVFDTHANYRRIGEFDSYGIGPHQLKLMPDGATLVVANGGIRTHPDSGRDKLNLDSMQPNLCYIDRHSGALLEQQQFSHHHLSIRHLDVGASGTVAVGMQYQGNDGALFPLVACHRRGTALAACSAEDSAWRQLNGYIASVLLLEEADTLVVSSPRGGQLYFWDLGQRRLCTTLAMADCAGLARLDQNLLVASSGRGELRLLRVQQGSVEELGRRLHPATQWDNHLTALVG